MLDTCPYPQPTPETVRSWEGFLYFVWEREAIRLARENGYDKPWTIDPIMEKYRFCNIRRRDDRVTKWLMSNAYQHLSEDDDMWFVAAIFRLINWPPTIAALLANGAVPAKAEEFDSKLFVSVIEEIIDAGGKAYSGAYMTYPGRETGSTKSEFFADRILAPLIVIADDIRSEVKMNTVEDTVAILSSSFGLSTFLAGQIAADLTYYDAQLGEATDLYSFAPLGPGSQSGLNYLTGNKQTNVWKQEEFNNVLMEANRLIKEDCGIMDLTLHDVQNCACEASKYFRTVLGVGKPRSLYKSETAF